jgi:peptidoglycan/LPS O-acetylase OafA/YrhL
VGSALKYIQNLPLLAVLAGGFFAVMLGCFNPVFRQALVRLLDHPRPPSTGNVVYAFDSLRGIAILMVVSFHLFQWFNPGFGALGMLPLIRNGWSGVELFVVLSGYLIYAAIRSGGTSMAGLRKYALRRLYRIYPVYLITVLVGLVLSLHGTTPFEWHWSMVKSLVTWQDWLHTGIYEILLLRGLNWSLPEIFNPPAWSLGVEVGYYLVAPLYVWLSRKQPLSLALGGLALLFLLKNHGPREFGILVFFWVGIVAYEIRKSLLLNGCTSICWWLMFLTGAILFFTFMWGGGGWVDMQGHHLYSRAHRTGYLVFGLLLMMTSIARQQKIAGLFSWYPFRVMGIISYSLFLWHFPLFAVSRLETLPALSLLEATLIFCFLVLPACLFLSGISYLLIERPFLKRRF